MNSHRKEGPAGVRSIVALCTFYGKRNHKKSSGWE